MSLIHEQDLLNLIEYHNQNSDYVVIDCETDSLNTRNARLLDVQISGKSGQVRLFPGHLAPLLLKLAKQIILVGHSIKYDLQVLAANGVDLIDRPFHDTILLAHLADENRASYSLDSFIKDYWNDDYKEQFWTKYKNYVDAPREEQIAYACKDVAYTEKLYRRILVQLRAQNVPDTLVEHVHRLQRELIYTEREGIKIDVDYLIDLGTKIGSRIEQLLPEMRRMVEPYVELCELEAWDREMSKRKTEKGRARVPKPVFSFDSSKQLISLLYDKLALPKQLNEKTKQVSVDEASLTRLKDEHAIIPHLLEYRELQKVQVAFIDGTTERIENERIYPEFRVNGTKTGRISAANPNLQQLPRGGGVRGIYVPNPGYVLISADYSSLEIYIAANFTQDASLKRIVLNGESMHDITAASLGIDRQLAKGLNFAEGYGCSHYKVAKLLKCSEADALKIHNKYWETYSGQKRLMDKCAKMVDQGLPIITPFGRTRRFEKKRRNAWDKAYRQAWNFLVQSTGADITNIAFYRFSNYLRKNKVGRAWFPLHDEVIAEVLPEHADSALQYLCQVMTDVGNEIGLEIPLVAQPSGPMPRWLD